MQQRHATSPVVDGDPPVVPVNLGLDPVDVPTFVEALLLWRPWYTARFIEGTGARWRSDRMEYAFKLVARTPSGDVLVEASAYQDGRLEWSDFDFNPLAPAMPAEFVPVDPENIQQIVLPQRVRYRGMPVLRFWEFEDRKVYLGNIDAGPSDLIRMMLVEFALLGADDWFVIPLDLPIGSLTRVDQLEVRNTFGESIPLRSAVEADGEVNDWRMFALHGDPAL